MHFLTIVVVPPGYDGDMTEYVERAMAPYDEEANLSQWVPEPDAEEGGWWNNPQSFWDWYQIGGRWSGHLSPSYDPTTDPRNIEVCTICQGTGTRDWAGTTATAEWIAECNGCNACQGKGTRTVWPTRWVQSETGNVARLGDVRAILEASGMAYLLHEGVTSNVDTPDVLETLSDDCTVVVVDTHC